MAKRMDWDRAKAKLTRHFIPNSRLQQLDEVERITI
jgi:hypothetical protein